MLHEFVMRSEEVLAAVLDQGDQEWNKDYDAVIVYFRSGTQVLLRYPTYEAAKYEFDQIHAAITPPAPEVQA